MAFAFLWTFFLCIMEISSFKEIVKNYKVVFFDAYGVLKTHDGLIPGVESTIKYLDGLGIDYYVLTNDASKGPGMISFDYTENGLYQATPDKILSSGLYTSIYLKQNFAPGSKILYLGKETSAFSILQANMLPIPIHEASGHGLQDIKAILFLDDESFDWRPSLNLVTNIVRNYDIPVIVANPDLIYPVNGSQVAFAIGGLAYLVERVTGKQFVRFGKPDISMFNFAYEIANRNMPVSKKDVLMVGDTLETDILGGNRFGIDTALVLSGNITNEGLGQLTGQDGTKPTYICHSIIG